MSQGQVSTNEAPEITEELLVGKLCSMCSDNDTCCPTCSFYDSDGRLYAVCHDCGVELNEAEEDEEYG